MNELVNTIRSGFVTETWTWCLGSRWHNINGPANARTVTSIDVAHVSTNVRRALILILQKLLCVITRWWPWIVLPCLRMGRYAAYAQQMGTKLSERWGSKVRRRTYDTFQFRKPAQAYIVSKSNNLRQLNINDIISSSQTWDKTA